MKYELDSNQVLKKLKSHDVKYLYHANTVRTSCTFFREGALLSRGTLKEKGLDQTDQYSDKDDIDFGIWYDIFLDTIDIHDRLDTANHYGPVLFKFGVDILSEDWLQSAWITKSNPANWKKNSVSYEDRYFHTGELDTDFDPKGSTCYQNHIMLRSVGGVLRLKPHLKSIIIDDPVRDWPPTKSNKSPLDIFSLATGALVNASRFSDNLLSSTVDLDWRQCKSKYRTMSNDIIKKIFGP